jgi:hypothetical protein
MKEICVSGALVELYWQGRIEVLAVKHVCGALVELYWQGGIEVLAVKHVCGALVELYWQGRIEVLAVKPVPVSLLFPQISNGLNLCLSGKKVSSNLLTAGRSPSQTVLYKQNLNNLSTHNTTIMVPSQFSLILLIHCSKLSFCLVLYLTFTHTTAFHSTLYNDDCHLFSK